MLWPRGRICRRSSHGLIGNNKKKPGRLPSLCERLRLTLTVFSSNRETSDTMPETCIHFIYIASSQLVGLYVCVIPIDFHKVLWFDGNEDSFLFYPTFAAGRRQWTRREIAGTLLVTRRVSPRARPPFPAVRMGSQCSQGFPFSLTNHKTKVSKTCSSDS